LLLAPARDRTRGCRDARPVLQGRSVTGPGFCLVPVGVRCLSVVSGQGHSGWAEPTARRPGVPAGRWPREPTRHSALPAAWWAPGRAAQRPGPGRAAERPAATDLTDTHLRISVPLGPAPPLPLLVPLGLLLSPGAPQTLPLCLNSHQLLPCSLLREKKRRVSPSAPTATALPTAGCRHRAGEGREEPGPLSYRSRRQEPEIGKERESLPLRCDGGGLAAGQRGSGEVQER